MCLALTSCGDSSTSSPEEANRNGGITTSRYPTVVAKQFVKSCVLNAKLTSSGKLSSDQAREICVEALACLEQNLTISEFTETERKLLSGKTNPGAKFFRSCTEEAIEQSVG